jgi:hypothetical protein
VNCLGHPPLALLLLTHLRAKETHERPNQISENYKRQNQLLQDRSDHSLRLACDHGRVCTVHSWPSGEHPRDGRVNIPNAQMILLNTATKVQQSGTSDASGLYRFTNLGPGEYQISSSTKGFQRAQAQFTLTAGENREVSLVLSVGSDTTSIVVTAQAPLLDTGDSREELTLNQAALENLPLATRNPVSLVGLTPGVTGNPGIDDVQS